MAKVRNQRWWEKPAAQGKQGRIVTVQGRDVTIECPKCKSAPIVYNGNYFCDNWAYQPGAGDCDWALEYPARTQADKKICDLVGIG